MRRAAANRRKPRSALCSRGAPGTETRLRRLSAMITSETPRLVTRIAISLAWMCALASAGCAQTVWGASPPDGGDATGRDVQCRDGDPDTSVLIYAYAPCDGTTIRDCQHWAQLLAGPNAVAQSTCMSIAGAHCRRATLCSDLTDASSCRCGAFAECGVGQVCAADYPGGPASCRCVAGAR